MAGNDVSAFEAVFQKHFADIYGYVAFRLAPRIEDARDLTQDVFIAGLKSWMGFRGETTPLQWLRAIARRKIADYFQNQPAAISTWDVSSVCETQVDCEAGNRAEFLSVVLRQITPELRELLEEKYLEGLSVREIAQQRGKTEKAIESALSRARQRVREKYLQFQTRTGDAS